MGYTHYWTPKAPASPEAWGKITADANKPIAAFAGKIALEYDEPGSPPLVSPDEILLNGVDDEGHETFCLGRDCTSFTFCKTAGKPYDDLVCAILSAATEHWPEIRVTSDGDAEDWGPALTWGSTVLGRPLGYPCKEEEDE